MSHNMAEMWKLHTSRLYYGWNVICVVVQYSFCCMLTHIRWLGKELEARCDPMGFRTTDTNSFTSSLDRSSSQALVSGCGSVSFMVHSYSQDITFWHINSISYISMQVLSPLHINILYLFPFSWFSMCRIEW